MSFPNPITPKVKEQKKTSPWDFRCPEYDERTSCYVNAGSHYGVGFTNPIGHTDKVKQRVPTMPFGHKMGMEKDEIPTKNLKQDYVS